MAEGLPAIELSIDGADQPVVVVDETKVSDPARLLELAPVLLEPDFAAAYAQLVNHLTHGYEFSVILDPAAYETSYRAEYEGDGGRADPNTTIDPAGIEPLDVGDAADPAAGEADADASPADAAVDLVFDSETVPSADDDEPVDPAAPGSLRSFGLPDFAAISPPRLEGDRLVFFARHGFYGIPYRVTVKRGALAEYSAMDMVGE